MAKYRITKDTVEPPMYSAERKDLFGWQYVYGTVSFSAEETQNYLLKQLKTDRIKLVVNQMEV